MMRLVGSEGYSLQLPTNAKYGTRKVSYAELTQMMINVAVAPHQPVTPAHLAEKGVCGKRLLLSKRNHRRD